MYHVFTRENEKTKTNLFTYSQVTYFSSGSGDAGRRKSPWWNQAGSQQSKLESIVCYAKDYGMQSNYKVTYKKEDKDCRYTTYEFFYGWESY